MRARNPKANALYRYIKDWKWFKIAIRTGEFVPRFCDEDYSWLEERRLRCLLFPMVCFCDIPLENSASHRRQYGTYVIGLKKEWGAKQGLNPLLYMNPDGVLASELMSRFNRHVAKVNLNPSDFGEFWPVLPYLKPVSGFQKNRRGHVFKEFEQEMEWRYIPSGWDSLIESRRKDDRTESEKETQNARIRHDRLRFTNNDIEIIIVNKAGQRRTLKKLRPTLRGKVKLWSEIKR